MSVDAVRFALRRRARQKVTTAERICTLRILGLSHEQARERLGLPVEAYHRAKRWLLAAAAESEVGGAQLPIGDALEQYADHHVERCVRVGMLRARGARRQEVQRQLGVSDLEYEIAWAWYRDAVSDARNDDD